MSLMNSILGPLSLRPRRSSNSQHELPLYNSPPSSPPTTVFPPPPVTLSMTLSRSSRPTVKVPYELLAVQRKARHLEQQIQEYLDAQSDGLEAGLNMDAPDDTSLNSSATATVSSIRDESHTSNKLSTRQKIHLNDARKCIYRCMQQLAEVKAEELDFLDSELYAVRSIRDKTETFSRKRNGLQERIRVIEHEGTEPQVNAMRKEADDLEQEIKKKEEELWAMKTKHRRLVNNLADAENHLEAKVASYKTSLDMLEKDISGFLKRPPDADHFPMEDSPFIHLPPNRRTLDMATEYWREEHARLEDKCNEVDIDRSALDEGSRIWKDVASRVMNFEKNFSKLLEQSGGDHKSLLNALNQMDDIIHYLEEQLRVASSRKWNLLICSIGAELEACKQGRPMLEAVLRGPAEENHNEPDASPHADSGFTGGAPAKLSPPGSRTELPSKPMFFDTDDEDPDPELLFSHRDEDTD
ncbi:hypothetical protein GQ43DRAFT_466721 [Delitschia confertaspora ATCC 74209]|uniref:Atg28p n=1 Tax=Delitschia confertaspora ATCC 74209 TaxID=1513339 RepID=A0A9P4JCN4_9PLEO|nr:hypothetical protein GQ43DRAFT_466721 [Delitschia confertaspora ATCC 74209]